MIRLAPSLFAADCLHLASEIDRMAAAGADYLHFDVMDGSFVPNYSFGTDVLRAVSAGPLPVDVHLMIEQPERYIRDFAAAGAKIISVHAEATRHLSRLLQQIREAGALSGVALNPATRPECLEYVMGEFDLVLIMSVNPGCKGQRMNPRMADKVGQVRHMLSLAGNDALIEVDGGLDAENCEPFVRNGMDIMVAGRALFGASDPGGFIRHVRDSWTIEHKAGEF